jgi:P4 family phage/plasmid primase-like protien
MMSGKIGDGTFQVNTVEDIWDGQPTHAWKTLRQLTSSRINHSDVAGMLIDLQSEMLLGKVIAFSINRSIKRVYIFNTGTGQWKLQADGGHMYFESCIENTRRALEKQVIQQYNHLILDATDHTTTKSRSGGSNDETDMLKSQRAPYLKLYERLGDNTFANNVIAKLIVRFIKESTDMEYSEDMFDAPWRRVLGFEDGIYDFESNRLITGHDAKVYYITQSVGYNYNDVLHVDSQHETDFQAFISQIIPDTQLRRYVFKRFNKALQKIVEKLVLIFYNKTGDNGKTVLMRLIGKTFGTHHYVKCNNNLIKKDALTSSSGPNEELVSIKGKSLVCFSEASGTLNMCLLKEMCGGDEISTRGNHEKKQVFVSTALPIILCNSIPSPDTKEQATFKKLRCVPFEAEFVDRRDKVNEAVHKYLRDENVVDHFDDWKYACMKYILSFTHADDIPEPVKVMEHTNRFREKEDVLLQFLLEMVEPTEEMVYVVSRSRLWKEWKEFSKDEKVDMKMSEFKENTKEYMESCGYKYHEDTTVNGVRIYHCWRGCRIKNDTSMHDTA